MLTFSPSLVNVIWVLLLLLPTLLVILSPLDSLAAIAPTTAATSASPTNAASSAVTSSSSSSNSSFKPGAIDSTKINASSSKSSSSSSSLLSVVSNDHDRRLNPHESKTASEVSDNKQIVRMSVPKDTLPGNSVSEGQRVVVQGQSFYYNHTETQAVDGYSETDVLLELHATESNSDLLLNRKRRSNSKIRNSSSQSNDNNNNSSNNSSSNSKIKNNNSGFSKSRKDKDKSQKEDKSGTAFWSEEIQLGCRELTARRYISDGFCTSTKAVREVVCTGHCLPIKTMPWYAEFVKTMSKSKTREWSCVEDVVKKKRVRLLCQNGRARFYRIRVVKSCKCQKVSNFNSTHSRKGNRKRRKRKRKGRNNRSGRGS